MRLAKTGEQLLPKFLTRNLCWGGGLTDSVGRSLILNSSAIRRPFRVRYRQKIRQRDPKSVCSVSRRTVMVGLLVTRRAAGRRVVTA